jgi:hypothetical protein
MRGLLEQVNSPIPSPSHCKYLRNHLSNGTSVNCAFQEKERLEIQPEPQPKTPNLSPVKLETFTNLDDVKNMSVLLPVPEWIRLAEGNRCENLMSNTRSTSDTDESTTKLTPSKTQRNKQLRSSKSGKQSISSEKRKKLTELRTDPVRKVTMKPTKAKSTRKHTSQSPKQPTKKSTLSHRVSKTKSRTKTSTHRELSEEDEDSDDTEAESGEKQDSDDNITSESESERKRKPKKKKPVRIIRRTLPLPSFDPKKDQAIEWIARAKNHRTAEDWEDDTFVKQIGKAMKGKAAIWYADQPDNVRFSPKDLFEAMRARYVPEETEEMAALRLTTLRQTKGETVQALAQRVRGLAKQCEFGEDKTVITAFINALANADMRKMASRKTYDSHESDCCCEQRREPSFSREGTHI